MTDYEARRDALEMAMEYWQVDGITPLLLVETADLFAQFIMHGLKKHEKPVASIPDDQLEIA